MDEQSPLEAPEGDWWDRSVNRRETIWLGVSGAWAVTMFGWMLGWMQFGGQNQTGPTLKVSPKEYRRKVSAYKERAGTAKIDGREVLVPAGEDVYVGALQWSWDGLPVVIEAGRPYTFHLSSYDVQHGFSVRRKSNLSQQVSLQVLPDYEWLNEMRFSEPGTFEVQCNEYCGAGHATMHGVFYVVDSLNGLDVSDRGTPPGSGTTGSGASDGGTTGSGASDGGTTGSGTNDGGSNGTGATGSAGVDDWLSDVGNYDGSFVDATGEDAVTVDVGATGNGGTFAFDPPAVRVDRGTTVTFSWVSNNHTVTVQSQPDGAGWEGHDSIEGKGFSTEHEFDTPGTYEYYCAPHETLGMKGAIEVK
ncbi:MAG: halocyanin domain-containing protein [Salinigranum sp.]